MIGMTSYFDRAVESMADALMSDLASADVAVKMKARDEIRRLVREAVRRDTPSRDMYQMSAFERAMQDLPKTAPFTPEKPHWTLGDPMVTLCSNGTGTLPLPVTAQR